MDIEEENEAKDFYIESDINGIHTPSKNIVELNQLDLYRLMHGYAKKKVAEHKELICGNCVVSREDIDEVDKAVQHYTSQAGEFTDPKSIDV